MADVPLPPATASFLILFVPLAAAGQIIPYIDLQPSGASGVSRDFATTGIQQAGSSDGHAGIWSGTAGSFVDLHPVGYVASFAYATTVSRQAGYAYSGSAHAGLWSGTAASFVDLHPAGYASSAVYALTHDQQAGSAAIGSSDHAGIWSGTVASFVDLNPAGYSRSVAQATTGSQQAGAAWLAVSGVVHAGIWSGTAASFVDLDSSLGAAYGDSQATGIWVDDSTILVVGYAHHLTSGNDHAILWTITPVPEPSTLALLGFGLLGGLRVWQRHRREVHRPLHP